MLLHQLLERLARHFFDDDLQERHPFAGVAEPLPGLEVDAQLLVRLEPAPAGQAGGVAHAHARRDAPVARVGAEVTQVLVPGGAAVLPERLAHVLLQWLVEVEHALLDELHDQHREHRLAERRAVDLGVGAERLPGRQVRDAEGARVDLLRAVEDRDRQAVDVGRARERLDPLGQRGRVDGGAVEARDRGAGRSSSFRAAGSDEEDGGAGEREQN